MHTHLRLVGAPGRQCHHCTAVGLFPGLALGSAPQGPRPALPYFRLDEPGLLLLSTSRFKDSPTVVTRGVLAFRF